jgi:hypothetical protein
MKLGIHFCDFMFLTLRYVSGEKKICRFLRKDEYVSDIFFKNISDRLHMKSF